MGKTGAVVVAGALMLSWVALFNHAPLVFADTSAYATAAIQREIPGMFSVFYSFLILPLHQGITLWPVVFVQGAIMAHLLWLVLRCVSEGSVSKTETLLIIAVLCVFSSLPWITGEIMPDVFSPVLLLGLFLLGFCSRQLGRFERVYLVVLTTAAITTHFSHVPIALGLILLCLMVWPFVAHDVVPLRRAAMLVLTPWLLAVSCMLTVNWLDSREIGLARNSSVFLLAKWIDDGPALSYLESACPAAGYALCAYVKELHGLTHDDLKWQADSPFQKIGTFDQLEPEARRIVWSTLRTHTPEILQRAILDAGRQLFQFATGDGLSPYFAQMVADRVYPFFGPEVANSLLNSKQGQGRLPVGDFSQLHLVAVILAVVFGAWTVVARRQWLPGKLVTLYAFVIAGVVWNATVTGGLSGPYDRYLARVIWLLCFAALIGYRYVALKKKPRGNVSGFLLV
jgi:hypothetical protein